MMALPPWRSVLKTSGQRRRLIIVVCVMAVGILLVAGRDYLVLVFDADALVEWLDSLGPWQVPMFLLAHVVATSLGIPGSLLVVVGGARFGVWWGSLWSILGATTGAIAAFWLARYLFHDWFQARFQRHPILRRLDCILDTHAFNCVLATRFVPISPFSILNFAFGLTSVSLGAYVWGTLLGITPGTIAYTWLGQAGAEALSGGSGWSLVAALGFLALMSLIPLWWQRRRSL